MTTPLLVHKYNLKHLVQTALLTILVVYVGATVLNRVYDFVPPFNQAPKTIKITAREPGVAYNTQAFCVDPSTTVIATPAHTEASADALRYIASRGTEQINWLDFPVGTNSAATHYYVDKLGAMKSEPVEITKDSASCFKKKAGVK